MRTILLSTIAILMSFVCNSQQSNISIKLYNLTTFEKTKLSSRTQPSIQTTTTDKNLTLLHPTIAIQWKTKKNRYKELELTNFMIEKNDTYSYSTRDSLLESFTTSGNKITQTFIGVRFEEMRMIKKISNKKSNFFFGIALNPYYKNYRFTPYTSNLFPSNLKQFGINGYIIPRFTYTLSSRLFIDINLPIQFATLNFESNSLNNPTIVRSSQRTQTLDFYAFPKYFSGRVGLGIHL